LVDTLNKIIYPVRKKFSNGVGKSIKPVFTPPRPGDVFRTLADISKAKEMLNYKPEVDFGEGLRKTVEYFETH
jgi:UDP-glucose 4-epimerase